MVGLLQLRGAFEHAVLQLLVQAHHFGLRAAQVSDVAITVRRRGLAGRLAAFDLRQQSVERVGQVAHLVVGPLDGAPHRHALPHRVARDAGHGRERTRDGRVQPGGDGPGRDAGRGEQGQRQRAVADRAFIEKGIETPGRDQRQSQCGKHATEDREAQPDGK